MRHQVGSQCYETSLGRKSSKSVYPPWAEIIRVTNFKSNNQFQSILLHKVAFFTFLCRFTHQSKLLFISVIVGKCRFYPKKVLLHGPQIALLLFFAHEFASMVLPITEDTFLVTWRTNQITVNRFFGQVIRNWKILFSHFQLILLMAIQAKSGYRNVIEFLYFKTLEN